jgi:hypothetical protein
MAGVPLDYTGILPQTSRKIAPGPNFKTQALRPWIRSRGWPLHRAHIDVQVRLSSCLGFERPLRYTPVRSTSCPWGPLHFQRACPPEFEPSRERTRYPARVFPARSSGIFGTVPNFEARANSIPNRFSPVRFGSVHWMCVFREYGKSVGVRTRFFYGGGPGPLPAVLRATVLRVQQVSR